MCRVLAFCPPGTGLHTFCRLARRRLLAHAFGLQTISQHILYRRPIGSFLLLGYCYLQSLLDTSRRPPRGRTLCRSFSPRHILPHRKSHRSKTPFLFHAVYQDAINLGTLSHQDVDRLRDLRPCHFANFLHRRRRLRG